ncbi:hypothetical protein CRE_15673 [Caenorhabditis remanei]|uniref:DUF7154 domain-containing protein n=1 Tax=Caenorhabditis remanei TaxID=31234 RepID=E3N832_CAERE|nr:hypothetical protein CRE_15673 [Caenorhabditis remanei]
MYAELQSRKGTIHNDSASGSSAPGTNEESITVEIIDTNPPPEFGVVDKQRHFGILRYTVTNRFRKLMLIALVNLVVFAAFFLFFFFLIIHLDKKHKNISISSTLPTPTAGPMNESANCSPKDATTLIFAYSNDLTPDQVLNTWYNLKDRLQSSNYDIYSYGRFDVNSDFKNHAYSSSIEAIENDIKSDLPNAAESFPSYYIGSNILSCIQVKSDIVSSKISMFQLVFNSDITRCGAKLLFLVKRLPNDTDISDLVPLLEKFHVSITFVVSEKPSGGMNQQVLYTLATKTNGFCIFAEDDMFQETPTWLPSVWPLYLVYSATAEVRSTGSVTLPVFNAPLVGEYHICMTLQDHGALDKFRMVHLEWKSREILNSGSGFLEETLESHAAKYGETTYIRKGPFTLYVLPYNMTLGFEYTDDEINILQIRIYSVREPYSSRITSIIMKNRFRKMIFLAVVSFIIFSVIITTVLLISFLPKSHSDYFETTTHSRSSATTANPFDRTDCSPNQNSTFYFAYSNDLTPDQVLNTSHTLITNFRNSYDIYSYARFDVNSNFIYSYYSSNFKAIEDGIKSDLPKATESYPSYYFGSNILSCIRFFFLFDIAHCGAKMFFLVKRLPNDTDVSDLVLLLEKFHISITFVVSEKPSGGMNQQVLYTLATKTNGFCVFAEDYMFQDTPTWLPSIWPLYLVYSVNAEVRSTGSVTLPVFNAPLVGDYHICMTLQDHGGLGNFRMIHLKWNNRDSSTSGSFEETLESHVAKFGETTYIKKGPYTLDAVPYNMTLEFEYSDDEINILQIRIYSVRKPYSSRITSIIMKNRFRKMIFLGVVSFIIFSVIITTVLLIVFLPKSHSDYVGTTTTTSKTISAPTTKTDTTTHSHSSSTTTNPFHNTDCTPNQKSTFFFAYSNDLTPDQVLNTWKSISENSKLYFETYALGRFDMMNNLNQDFETIVSSNSFSVIYGALLSGLPNSTESIKDPSEGSAVLDIIDFFFKLDVTHCGATLFILTKRLPAETYIDDLVSKLKKNHAHVTFVVSNNSFGGSSSEPMYRLASETNGLCIFTDDDWIQESPFWLPSIWPSYLVYSVNAEVIKSGTVDLPIFNSPLVGYYYICMTLQDHGSLDTFRMVHLRWSDDGSSISGSFEETVESHTDFGNTTYTKKGPFTLDAVPYEITLQFEFLGEKTETLQIRIYSVQ